MTDSGTWWKADTQPRAEVTASRSPAAASGAALILLVALGGFSGCGTKENNAPVTDAMPSEQPVAATSVPSVSSPATGLTPLPTREQVLSSVPEGRADPFAPVVGGSKAVTAQIEPVAAPPGLEVMGVLAVGSELRALVSLSDVSGTVCVGQRGRCPGDAIAVLPTGWTVNSIDLGRGCLNLSIAGESQRRCIT